MESTARTSTGGFKAVSITTLVLVIAGAAGALWFSYQHSQELERVQADAMATRAQVLQQATEVATDLASDLTATIAVLIADDVGRLEFERVNAALATVVHGHRVAGVVVLAPDGTVVAATDQRFAGRTMGDVETRAALMATGVTVVPNERAPGEVEIVAPLVSANQKVGAIRVFLDLGSFAPRTDEPAD
jgi:uncharacterized membrane protein affecting hemolysin expression